jgi:hypothetical protein
MQMVVIGFLMTVCGVFFGYLIGYDRGYSVAIRDTSR